MLADRVKARGKRKPIVGSYFKSEFLPDAKSVSPGKSGTITCVHWKSMKGLEADAVFVPEFESHNMGADGNDAERMRFYVMFSRAREYLEILYDKDTEPDHPMLTLMREKGGEDLEWSKA